VQGARLLPYTNKRQKSQRRIYPDELKKEAVQMLFDGHSASSVAHNLGIGHTSHAAQIRRNLSFAHWIRAERPV
jgi:transposase-like protein